MQRGVHFGVAEVRGKAPTSSLCPCCAGHVKSGKERLTGAGPLSGVL